MLREDLRLRPQVSPGRRGRQGSTWRLPPPDPRESPSMIDLAALRHRWDEAVLSESAWKRLALTDDELATATSELAAMLDHFADIDALDLDDVERAARTARPVRSHPCALRRTRDRSLRACRGDRRTHHARGDGVSDRGLIGRAKRAIPNLPNLPVPDRKGIHNNNLPDFAMMTSA